jgi:biopolymer transport protein ExbB/TolQ
MKDKTINLLISFFTGILLVLFFYLLSMAVEEGSFAHRLLVMLGGDLPAGLIQGFTYILFCYGVLDIFRLRRSIDREWQSLGMHLLPEKEQLVLGPEEVAGIKLKMIDIQAREDFIMVDLIKQACTKFRANKSVSEALDLLTVQSAVYLRESESEQSMIRYVIGAIPSVGFIGTVIGIAASLGAANDAITSAGISKITGLLNIAFDTTLVALVLSIFLLFFFHRLEEKVEKTHTAIESYILENLINRIYVR